MFRDTRNVSRLALLSMLLISPGCSALVDPGQTRPMARTPPQPGTTVPAAWNGRAREQPGEFSRVPASSVVKIEGREEKSVYHEVSQGETLSGIARKYDLTLGKLLELNGLQIKAVIQPGQLLYIPR